jgi:hypothetical protein
MYDMVPKGIRFKQAVFDHMRDKETRGCRKFMMTSFIICAFHKIILE